MVTSKRIGILGGGQLGKMLAQAGSRWSLNMSFLEKSAAFPVSEATGRLVQGDFTSYQDVLDFGKSKDIITIEIENVNTEALHQLEQAGKLVYPQPQIIETIKDKGLQKLFYVDKNLPTPPFRICQDAQEIRELVATQKRTIPFVQKARTEGYDGRGVHIVRDTNDLNALLDVPSVIEDLVEIDKELSIIVARNRSGAMATYALVEMTFHPTANLVEELISPARVSAGVVKQASQLAKQVVQSFDLVGLLAIELFLTQDGSLLINEVAPRPHNSGHQTIEGNITSQYEQLLRAILNLPLGSTELLSPSVMVNVLGSPGYRGHAIYEGLEQVLAVENVHAHLYGKKETKPFRKMGHLTILGSDVTSALEKAKSVRRLLKVVARTKPDPMTLHDE